MFRSGSDFISQLGGDSDECDVNTEVNGRNCYFSILTTVNNARPHILEKTKTKPATQMVLFMNRN